MTLALPLALWALSAEPTPTPREVLCISVEAAATHDAQRLASMIADALAARLTSAPVAVRPCAEPTAAAGWVRVVGNETQAWYWELQTQTTTTSGQLDVPQGSYGRLTIQVAINVAEALRPALEAWFAQLQLEPPPTPAAPTPTPTILSTAAPPPEPAMGGWVAIGPRAHWQRPWVTESLELFLAPTGVGVRPLAGLVLQELHHVRAYQVRLAGESADLHVGILQSFQGFSLALSGIGRVIRLRLESDQVTLKSAQPWFFNVGAGLGALFPCTTVGGWTLALYGRAELWWQPRRFVVVGNTMMRQSHGEFTAGVAVGLPPTILNLGSPEQ